MFIQGIRVVQKSGITNLFVLKIWGVSHMDFLIHILKTFWSTWKNGPIGPNFEFHLVSLRKTHMALALYWFLVNRVLPMLRGLGPILFGPDSLVLTVLVGLAPIIL